jgi:arsenite methyltransferase
MDSDSVDYIISNCVINPVPDKLSVLSESYRVLKEGGTFAVAYVTLQNEISDEAKRDMDSWSACIAGALTDSDYRAKLLAAGFVDVDIEHISNSNIGEYPFRYYSSHIRATKPSSAPSTVR